MVVYERVREILIDQLAVKADLVKLESNLSKDLGADSLDGVQIVSSIEERFDIEIANDEVMAIATVGDLVNLVEKKVQMKSPSSS